MIECLKLRACLVIIKGRHALKWGTCSYSNTKQQYVIVPRQYGGRPAGPEGYCELVLILSSLELVVCSSELIVGSSDLIVGSWDSQLQS